MPELSDEVRERRRYAVDFARDSVQLSRGEPGPEAEALGQRYMAGDLSLDEYRDASIAYARSLPAGEPVQQYFTSLGEALNSVPAR